MKKHVLPALIIFCIFQMVFINQVFPQTYPFQSYTVAEGLPQSTVTTILQDKQGYMWFGTWNGLCKFDGKVFTLYSKEDGLAHNVVLSMLEDTNGNLWFGTNGGGISRFDGKTWHTFTQDDGLSNNYVLSMLEDKKGRLWFATQSGVSSFDGSRWETFTTENGLADNYVSSILEDTQGILWFATPSGVSAFDGRAWRTLTEEDGLAYNVVRSLLEDSNGDLWFGTEGGGVSRFGGGKWRSFDTKDGLVSNDVNSIFEDSEGDLWFATRKGVSKFNGSTWTTITEDNGLTNNVVFPIFEDRESNLWFGTVSGGVSKLGKSAFLNFKKKDGLASDLIFSVLEDTKGNLWFGTYGSGVTRFDGKEWRTFNETDGLANPYIQSMVEDKEGKLWVAGRSGASRFDGSRWKTFNTYNGLSDNVVISTLVDTKGNIWFGTQEGGVSRFDGRTWSTLTMDNSPGLNRVTALLEDKNGQLWFGTYEGVKRFDGKKWKTFNTEDGLAGNFVIAIFEDTEGNMWFGTEGNGVCKYDGSSFVKYTKENGLSDNTCYFIIQDNNNYLYFGTNRGVNRFDGKTFKVYTTQDGLASNEMNRGACIKDSQGNLWFGTTAGVSRFNPRLDKPNLIPPPVYITRVSLLGNDSTITAGSELKHYENHLRFDYAGILFTATEALVYNYKLEGLNKDWQESTLRTVQFTYLPSGQYTFKVRAMNKDHVWSQAPAEFSFVIDHAFWNTWWFRLSFMTFTAGLLLILFRAWYNYKSATDLREKNVQLRNEVTERKKAEESLKHRLEVENLVSSISTEFINLSLDRIDRAINGTLKKIGVFSGVDRGYLYLFSEDGTKMSNTHKWCVPGIKPQKVKLQDVPTARIPWSMEKLGRFENIHLPRIADLPAEAVNERELLERRDIKSAVAVPLIIGSSLKGILGFDSMRREMRWEDEDITLLKTVGDILVNALERKRVEEALQESGKRFRELAELLPEIVFEMDEKGILTFVNQNGLEQSGYSLEDYEKGFEAINMFVESDRDRVKRSIKKLMNGKLEYPNEYTARRKDGSTLPVLVHSTPIVRNGKTVGLRGIIFDISDRKRAEEVLRESEEKYRCLFENLSDAAFLVDVETGQLVEVNKQAEILGGRYRDKIIGSHHTAVRPPGKADQYQREFYDNVEAGGARNYETEVVREDGTVVPILVGDTIVTLGGSKFLLGTCRDVTERKKAEEALRESEERFSNLMNNIPVSIIGYNLEGTIFYWNKSSEKIYGFKAREAMGKNLGKLIIPPNLKPLFGECLKIGRMVKTSGEFMPSGELILKHKKGHPVSVHSIHTAVVIEKKPPLLFCIDVDLSERKRAEEALQESENRYRLLAENVTDIIWIMDLHLRFTYFSPSVKSMLGYNLEEAYNRRLVDILLPSSFRIARKVIREELAKEKAGGPLDQSRSRTLELELYRKDGSTVWCEAKASFLRDNEGRPVGILGVARDITQRRMAQQQLISYQERLRSMASELSLAEERQRRQIAADLHDRIGQTLAISKNKLHVLQQSKPSALTPRELTEIGELIEQAIRDARSLTFELSPPVLYELGFESAVEWLVEQHQKKHGIITGFRRDRHPKPLTEDFQVLLFQTVRELLLNVAKHSKARSAQVSISRKGAEIIIRIEDDGIGFDRTKLQFYPDDKGGFGLFSIGERLSHLGGSLDIDSQPHAGTRITVKAPLKKIPKNQKGKPR